MTCSSATTFHSISLRSPGKYKYRKEVRLSSVYVSGSLASGCHVSTIFVVKYESVKEMTWGIIVCLLLTVF